MSRVGSTGCGWLAAVLPLVAAWLGSAVGANVGFQTDHDFDGLIGGAAAGELIAAAALFLIGFAVNSSRTPQGRVWTNKHAVGKNGFQWFGVTFALVMSSIPLAGLTGLPDEPLGWATLAAVLAATAGISRLIYVKTCAVVTAAA